MSLGNLLLQPQRLQRPSHNEPGLEAAQDLMRLAALLAEDAAEEGELAGVLPALLERISERIRVQAEAGIEGAFSDLKAHFRPVFVYFDTLVEETGSLEADPGAILDMLGQLIDGLEALAGSADQAGIKAQLDFFSDLLARRLGIGPDFINQQIGLLFDDLIALWQALPESISPKRRRRKRLAIQILRRLRRHLVDRFTLPAIDTAKLAVRLYQLLRSSGLAGILAEIRCVLAKFNDAAGAVDELRQALPSQGESVGSAWAIISPQGSAEYCWYASWLLSDVDLALIGTGDIKDKKAFVNLFRTHHGISLKTETVSRFFFSTLTDVQQQQVLDYDGTSDPSDQLIHMLVGHLNYFMQSGPIYRDDRFGPAATLHGIPQEPIRVPFTFTLVHDVERIRPQDHFTADLRALQGQYEARQDLLLYNRRFLEWAYGETILDTYTSAFWRYVRRKTIGRERKVYISGDRRYLMVDDMPVYSPPVGTELKWEEAPLFIDKGSNRTPPAGTTWYGFKHVSAFAMEVVTQIFFTLEQTARPIWHLATLQPGHQIGTGIISGIDILYALNEIFFGKPMQGYESLGGFGDWLMSDWYGPRGIALLFSSLQGLHTEATPGNGWWFWVTVVLGDYIRLMGQNGNIKTLRDLPLSFMTLLNSRESNSGSTTLPGNPAANHRKQEGVVGPVNLLFIFLMMLAYKRENHSINIWTADGIGDQRAEAFGLWFGGSIGFAAASAITGSLIAQLTAWTLDWKRFGITFGESALLFFLGFWFFEYALKEGDTDDGHFAKTDRYKGYPAKANCPYKLPAAAGTNLYMGQGNNGLFSHNQITNRNGNWQVYAFDLGFDHRQIVKAMRAGVVWDFDESHDDNNEDDANYIIIRHSGTPVADHDDPYGTGTPVVTYARYWHGAKDGITNAFGSTPTKEKDSPGSGTVVSQGDDIMQADDTGTSFHSHLHIYVALDDGGSPGDESIPFVFADVPGDGLMEFLTWYKAGG